MKKVAIVTGASRGIGAATAKLLAANGYAVCINYHNSEAKAKSLVTEIQEIGGTAIAVKANMSSETDILNLFKTVDKELGLVNALVNNAGENGGICTVEDITLDQLQSVFSTNVFGTFIASREAIKRMKQQGGGCIVNVSSEAAKFGGNNMTSYAASKAAISTMTIGLAREVAKFNIRVTAVSPGVISTDLHSQSTSEKRQALMNSLPIGRMGTPEEVAETISWLLSDKASYLSGSILTISGGR